jgi:hypothetical protein
MRLMTEGHRQSPRRARGRAIGITLISATLTLFSHVFAALPLAAAPPAGAGAASSSTGSAPTAQPPVIPLSLPVVAHCTRSRCSLKLQGCDSADQFRPDIKGLWTPKENCLLSRAYNEARWSDVQTIVRDFLSDLDCKDETGKEWKVTPGYYSALFFNEGAAQAPAVARVLVHFPDHDPEIFGNRVGRFDMYDLQLLPDLGIAVTTVYQASTSPNAAISQIPGVLTQVAGASKGVPAPLVIAPTTTSGAGSQPPPLVIAKNLSRVFETQAIHSLAELTDRGKEVGLQPEEELEVAPSAESATFAIGRVNSPPAFKRGGLATASVVPQVSVTDQLLYSPTLERYVLAGLQARTALFDSQLQGSQGCANCSAGPGLVAKVNNALVEGYRRCTALQVALLPTKDNMQNGLLVTAQVSDALGNPVRKRDFQAAFTLIPVGGGAVVPCPVVDPPLVPSAVPGSLPPGPQPIWQGLCVGPIAPGPYLVNVTIRAADELATSAPPRGSGTAAIVVGAGTPGGLMGSLMVGNPTSSLGPPVTLSYGLQDEAANSTDGTQALRVKIYRNPPNASATPELDERASVALTKGSGSGSIAIDSDAIGPGSFTAVLYDPVAKPLAAVVFAVSAGGSSAQAAGGAATPSGSGCLQAVFQSLRYVEGAYYESQQLQQDAANLYSSYTALFSMSTGQPSSAPPSSPTQYTFGNLTRWSFSLGVAGIAGSFLNKPATVTMNMVEPNPPTPVLTFVTADLHIRPYDETRFSPTPEERIRLLTGVAITPSAGLVVGLGCELIRGLSLEGGSAFLLSNVLPNGETFKTDTSNKTSLGFYGRLFFGLGYSFQ